MRIKEVLFMFCVKGICKGEQMSLEYFLTLVPLRHRYIHSGTCIHTHIHKSIHICPREDMNVFADVTKPSRTICVFTRIH